MKVYIVQATANNVWNSSHSETYTLCVFETESLAREYVKKHQPKYRLSGGYLEVRSWDVLNKVD